MALSRSFLTGMGLTAEQVTAIVEAHSETVNALKAQGETYKADAEASADKDKEIAALKKEVETLKADGDEKSSWKEKYEAEHTAFEAYKTEVANTEAERAVKTAYRDLLKECGVSEKRLDSIMKVTDLKEVSLDKDGAIKGKDKLVESIKTEWADFITSSVTKGADTKTPPGNAGGNAFEAMSLTDKMAYANEHPSDPMVVAWLS